MYSCPPTSCLTCLFVRCLAFSDNAVNPGDFVNSLGTTTNIVDAVILSLTIVGAGGVMINVGKKEWQSGKGSTIRSRLVLFLVFGDLVLG